MADTESESARKPVVGRSKRYWRRALEVLIVLAVLFGVHVYQTRNLVAGEAPDFQARLIDGTPVRLSDLRGQPVMLQFWATWCPVCRLEQGSIDAIADDHKVISIALEDSTAGEIESWMNERDVSYPVVRDASGSLASLYGVHGVPTTVIVDADGHIRFAEVGYTTEIGMRLRLWWAGL